MHEVKGNYIFLSSFSTFRGSMYMGWGARLLGFTSQLCC